MNHLYNEDYYERGIELNISGYSNYRWIPELTIPMAFRLIEVLGIREYETVLDYGCAKGYLVKALRLLHREAYGYDVSDYAINAADADTKPFLMTSLPNKKYDWVICKDVLEHIPYENLDDVLSNLASISKRGFFVVPLAEDGKYNVPSYEHDTTHIIREDLTWWENKLKFNGFNVSFASYRLEHIKENYAHWEKGNGFFITE